MMASDLNGSCSPPESKRPRLEDSDSSDSDGVAVGMISRSRVVLALCGSFSPVTYLHLRMFEVARDYLQGSGQYEVVEGVLSPVHESYKKKGLVESNHRLNMCRLALASSDWIRLDPWETEQSGWKETVNALRHIQETVDSKSPGAKVKLLCGGDLLESFATPGLWKQPDITEIVGKFGLVVISRFGSNPEKFVYESDQLSPFKSSINIVTEWIPNDVSSTKIRRSLRRGESVKYLIPDDVIDYIKEHKLYRGPEVIC